MYLVFYKRPRFKFLSLLHHPGISMLEERAIWTSTSCRSVVSEPDPRKIGKRVWERLGRKCTVRDFLSDASFLDLCCLCTNNYVSKFKVYYSPLRDDISTYKQQRRKILWLSHIQEQQMHLEFCRR